MFAYFSDSTSLNLYLVIYGSKNNTIVIWDLLKNKSSFVLEGHEAPVSILKLLDNGYMLASGANDHTIKLWNLKTNSCICTLNAHTDIITYMDELSDERLISASFDGMIKTWDLNACTMIDAFSTGASIAALKRFDTSQLAVFYSDFTLKIWDLERGKFFFNIKSLNQIICFQKTGKYLISGHFDGKIKFWNKTNWRVAKSIEENSVFLMSLVTLDINETEHLASIDQFGVIKIWCLVRFSLVNMLYGFSNTLQFQIFYMNKIDSRRIMSRSAMGLVRIWEFNSAANDSSLSPESFSLENCLPIEGMSSVIYFNRTRFESIGDEKQTSAQVQGFFSLVFTTLISFFIISIFIFATRIGGYFQAFKFEHFAHIQFKREKTARHECR